MPDVVLVIAPRIFRDEEYDEPKQVFEANGFDVTTASLHVGESVGKLGMIAHPEITVTDAAARDWDGVVFVGGAGAEVYFDDADAHALAHRAYDAGGIVSAICIAPSILAHAGMLNGVKVTAFESQREDVVSHGAQWTGDRVTVDGRIVTGNGPAAAREFGEAVVKAVQQRRS